MVYTTDLKSVVRKDVPVRVRPWAPFIFQYYKLLRWSHACDETFLLAEIQV